MTDLAELIRRERLELIDFLTTLSPEEWATPSLCGEWTVQDVAAHLASAPSMSPMAMLGGLVRAGFRVNRFNADNAKQWARRGPDAILGQLRANAADNAQPSGMPLIAGLADAVVHGLDIRRPLERTGPIAPEVFGLVADAVLAMRWPVTISIGGSPRDRVAGVRLLNDETGWSHGAGPEARAGSEAILLLLHGRAVTPGELTGPGAEKVYARLAA